MSIQRIECKRTGAWKVVRREKSKYFSDRKFGGKKEALAAAKEFQETLPQIRVQAVYNIKTHPKLFAQVRKGSGVKGVFGLVVKRPKNSVQYYWVAQKCIQGTRYIRKFSVGTYGHLALKKAIETRQAWDAELK